ncbi:MAG: winged helix DNA-binding domain-containing protein [Clostridiales bacterium]|jgi:hypothetical protein|nr:winged helix DNA-binding domain-containing protein [Clostridiales bacterium]
MEIDRRHLLYATLKNQYLIEKAPCRTVISGLLGLQTQFANNPKYALIVRGSDYDAAAWERGLVKLWTFRDTLHAVHASEAGLFLSAKGRPETWENRWGVEPARMEYWSAFALEKIRSGVTGRDALKEACSAKGMAPDELALIFNGWGGLFKEMNRRGLIAYAPGTEKTFAPLSRVRWVDRDEARKVILKRYFHAFGPATAEDFATFAGYPAREAKSLIKNAGFPLRSVFCGGTEYLYTGALPSEGDIPPYLFLTGFDQMMMGYRDRSRILDAELLPEVRTLTGIFHPLVLVDGRVAARWRMDGGKIQIRPLKKLPEKTLRQIAERAEGLFGAEKPENA